MNIYLTLLWHHIEVILFDAREHITVSGEYEQQLIIYLNFPRLLFFQQKNYYEIQKYIVQNYQNQIRNPTNLFYHDSMCLRIGGNTSKNVQHNYVNFCDFLHRIRENCSSISIKIRRKSKDNRGKCKRKNEQNEEKKKKFQPVNYLNLIFPLKHAISCITFYSCLFVFQAQNSNIIQTKANQSNPID